MRADLEIAAAGWVWLLCARSRVATPFLWYLDTNIRYYNTASVMRWFCCC